MNMGVGGKGGVRKRDREDDKKISFVVLAHGENKRCARARRAGSSSRPLCLSLFPPLLFKFLVQTDRYEALILAQLKKSNHAGVKSYGLASNKLD